MSTATALFLLIASLLLAPEFPTSLAGNNARIGEWRLLTKSNFLSEINLCPRSLVLLFNPWSGEARSLMSKISELVKENENEIGLLELLYVHKNKERTLTEAIVGEIEDGATVKVIYYHNSQPYWYRGALVAKSIIFSVFPYVAGFMEHWDGVPATRLETKFEVDEFLASTDKALILIERCGWTQNLLEANKNFGKNFVKKEKLQPQGEFSGMGVNDEYNIMNDSDEKHKENNLRLACARESEFNGLPRFVQEHAMSKMTFLNDSTFDSRCPLVDVKKFEGFFSSFLVTARNFFFPRVKQRFGIVTKSSLLPYFGIEDSRIWHAMLYVNGCPTCSKFLKEENNILSVLQNTKNIVSELEDDMLNFFPAIPSSNPSIILFVDRSSASQDLRLKSYEALDLIRKLALHYKLSSEIYQQNDEQSERSKSEVAHPKAKFRVPAREKVSVMLLDQSKQTIIDDVVSHPVGNSLQELLARVLQRKDSGKLRSLAKEVGFHLLSHDLNIKLQSAEPEAASKPEESSVIEPLFDRDSFSRTSSDDQPQSQNFNGSFFFFDGNYQLLNSLSGESVMPSLVLIDPSKKKHYVFPTENNITLFSVEDFISEHLQMRVSSFNKVVNQTRTPHPAHADSLPQITHHILVKFISEFSSVRSTQDVLLLLTNDWCGFCQRMHLVVHEVYKAIRTLATSQHFDKDIPKIFEMDCSSNDCSAILQALQMREVFPTTILFSSKNRKPLLYEGNMAVIDVLRFMAKNSHSLPGILGIENVHDSPKLFEILLNDRNPETTELAMEADMEGVKVVVGTVLLATEKIETQPFEDAMVVIVRADERGFEGLIYNKPITWDSIKEFDSDYEHVKGSTLYFGGPLMRVGQPLAALTRLSKSEEEEVGDGIYFLDQSETENRIKEIKEGNAHASDYWLFFGFSKWDSAQLYDEIAVGAWNVTPRFQQFHWPL